MKKNSQRKPKPKMPQKPAAGTKARGAASDCPPAYEYGHEERKVGVVSGTPADAFDETNERKRDRWVAIYISVLAVLLTIAATGSNDAMKTAQQAGFQVNDQYGYYQAKTIRQQQIKIASDQLELKLLETPSLADSAQKLLQSKKSAYDKEIARLESDAKNGKIELLARAESCENLRNTSLAQHPFYDYSMAMLQIAIVLASASIITGTRLLLAGSGAVGLFGILLFLNGYTLVYGFPDTKHKNLEALQKALPSAGQDEILKITRCPVE
jgi:Domain of unknown function (DUF4337)